MGNQCLQLQKSREIRGRKVHWKAISFSSLHHQINSPLNQPGKWVWNLYKVFLCYQNPLLFTIQRCLLTDLGFKTNTAELLRKRAMTHWLIDSLTIDLCSSPCSVLHFYRLVSLTESCLSEIKMWISHYQVTKFIVQALCNFLNFHRPKKYMLLQRLFSHMILIWVL